MRFVIHAFAFRLKPNISKINIVLINKLIAGFLLTPIAFLPIQAAQGSDFPDLWYAWSSNGLIPYSEGLIPINNPTAIDPGFTSSNDYFLYLMKPAILEFGNGISPLQTFEDSESTGRLGELVRFHNDPDVSPVETVEYRYDALGRLISTEQESIVDSFDYDPAGNRTTINYQAR